MDEQVSCVEFYARRAVADQSSVLGDSKGISVFGKILAVEVEDGGMGNYNLVASLGC